MALFDRLTKTAQENKQRIVLAEGTEPRTLTAADMIIHDDHPHRQTRRSESQGCRAIVIQYRKGNDYRPY